VNARSYLQQFGDVELAVRSSGSGLPFVWAHSLLGSMQVEDRAALWDWDEVERHATVVRYDARGHGNSDGSYRAEDYRWGQMADDMLAVAEYYACGDRGKGRGKRYLLGGISMGAATTLDAALKKPGRVAGMVLTLPPTAWDTRPRQAAIYRRLGRVSGLFGSAPYRLLDLLPVPLREDGRSQLALNTMKSLAQANPLHVQAALGGAAMSDMADKTQLRNLKVPTLILAWEDDASHPVSTAEELADLLPGVRELVICHPSDTSDWQRALGEFVQDIASTRTRRRAAAARA